MKKALFGKNIPASCEYCENCESFGFASKPLQCLKNKKIKNGRCRSFKYDPLLRTPKTARFDSGFTAEDFKL